MTAIIVIKRGGRRSLLQWLFPDYRSVTYGTREVGDRLFQFLLCEVELPDRPGKRCYTKIKKRIVETLMQYDLSLIHI